MIPIEATNVKFEWSEVKLKTPVQALPGPVTAAAATKAPDDDYKYTYGLGLPAPAGV